MYLQKIVPICQHKIMSEMGFLDGCVGCYTYVKWGYVELQFFFCLVESLGAT